MFQPAGYKYMQVLLNGIRARGQGKVSDLNYYQELSNKGKLPPLDEIFPLCDVDHGLVVGDINQNYMENICVAGSVQQER